MFSISPSSARWLSRVAVAALLVPLVGNAGYVQAAAPIRVVGCSLDSLNPDLPTNPGVITVGAEPEDDDTGGEDQVEEDQQPKIVGSIPKPRGVSEDNSRALTPLATVPRDQAVTNAVAALANPDQRRVRRVAVEGENGWLVWSVKTVRLDPSSGPDPNLELKLDAGGNGDVLSIECELDDD